MMVVGAGLAGVACARELARAGVPVQLRERGQVAGGRMASRRFAGRPVDLGAAYLTVSDPGFAAVLRQWRAAGLAREWTDTFLAYGGEGRRDVVGPMRWAAPRGLRSLVEQLAQDLPVSFGHPVRSVGPGPTVDGQPCAAVVLAMPGPQAAPLLDPALTAATRATRAQGWSPSLAAMLRFPERCWSGLRGAFINDHPVLALVCDDGDRRGDAAPVLVAHTTPEFAAAHLGQPAVAASAIEAAVRDLLALPVSAEERYVHRWTYARPTVAAAGTYYLDAEGIGLAGDAFGAPRAQTAWRSGHDLAGALLARRAEQQ
ncbi:NAD(P)/FAD-dependent oxidoreductase [Salinispora mooreana]|uniref:NAD(P)/FAD-dependent oxidoreductase n=1 Tax=Salinispora mooreana TaxID=999545 RepID=UPI0003675A57|nr:FAD-dependent oxidoreductase [Salinispora mooreana]